MSAGLNPELLRAEPASYDAILLASFGGPEGQDEVLPFLRTVAGGRGIPDGRLEEVSHHYRANGGVSPSNAQNRVLKAALEAELASRGIELPVLWGNRNCDPYIPAVLQEAYDAGHRRILMLTTGAFTCYSSDRQYREEIGLALRERGLDGKLAVDKVRQYFDHPGFVEPFIEGTAAAVDRVRASLAAAGNPEGRIHVLFSTHSIPTRDAGAAGRSVDDPRSFEGGSAYVAQHLAVARVVMAAAGPSMAEGPDFSLVYQSRSGAPHVPWLEPDINDAIAELAEAGVDGVVVVPLGFVSDHMEVLWDLDTGAAESCAELGLAFDRVPTPGTHPKFVAGLVDLVCERTVENHIEERPALTDLGPWYDVAPANCSENFHGAKPAIAENGSTVGLFASLPAPRKVALDPHG